MGSEEVPIVRLQLQDAPALWPVQARVPGEGPVYPFTPAKIKQELSVELSKLNEIIKKSMTKAPKKSRRGLLMRSSLHVFATAVTSGVTLGFLCIIWLVLLTSARVVYTFPTNYTTPGAPNTIEVKSPFLYEIKFAFAAFAYYSCGTIMLFAGGWLAFFRLQDEYYQPKTAWLFGTSVLFLLSAFAMVMGPLLGVWAGNTKDETRVLNADPNYAYHESIKGSIKYFQDRQCGKIDAAVAGRDEEEAIQMRAFCTMMSCLIFVYYVMWATVIFPVMGFIFCWLQIACNKKGWDERKLRLPKKASIKPEVWVEYPIQVDQIQKD